jgi:hypothetical protein
MPEFALRSSTPLTQQHYILCIARFSRRRTAN